MLILTLRTDKPESEIGLFADQTKLAYRSWKAHRQLAETIHTKLEQLLKSSGKTWQDIGGVIVYEGPGSFTGLRIGMSVANAVAYSLDVPIIAVAGVEWINHGRRILKNDKGKSFVTPNYGSLPNVTTPKK